MAFDRHRLAARTGRVLRPAAAAIFALSVASAVSLACGEKKPETTPEPEFSEVVVRLDRSDGFSFDEHLVVNKSRASVRFRYRGPTDQRGTRRFTLSTPQVVRLGTALEQAGFSDLDSRYEASEGSEAVAHSVTYAGRTVVVDEEALKSGKVPERLARVLSLLNGLLDSKVPTPRNQTP
jgi:hypothetical protein